VLDLKELSERAKKVINLAKLMDEAFDNGHEEDHLKLAIMAGLNDTAYDGFRRGEKSAAALETEKEP
jgi:hypothetical protein